ncbi:hypothetical protein IMZ48_11350, partial [Candidatus Bathyarchaeota archaeon]|nr:hypothetical protein [Candidatus Bathyarchaeota archaeon]
PILQPAPLGDLLIQRPRQAAQLPEAHVSAREAAGRAVDGAMKVKEQPASSSSRFRIALPWLATS